MAASLLNGTVKLAGLRQAVLSLATATSVTETSVPPSDYLRVKPMTIMQSAQESIGRICEQTDEAMLFCSLGKDSLVLLDLIYPKFKRIVCVFMYFVKGLEHIDRWIMWVKKRYPKVEFVQVPHWNLTYVLRGGLYCVANLIIMSKMYSFIYCFLGMKKADGMNRNLMLKGYGSSFYENGGLVYPLAEWTQKNILSYMKQHKLPSPVRYGKNASNGVGFNLDCFLWMRQNYPNDLQKVYKVFPMSERILWEYDQKVRTE